MVKPRGGCVNLCDYCAKLQAVENCEMLVLDALEGDAPQLIAILGTRTATLDMEAFANARREVVRAVRRRWPDAEYAYEVEFTTGYGPKSGGRRRPHWNWFWKRIPRADWTVASWVIVTTWCRYVDAEPRAQYVDLIRNEIGLTKYITEHFMKASQRPPSGFRGQRFCASRGYFGLSVQTARARARESLKLKRELWKASRVCDNAHDVELLARESLERAYATVWVLTNDRGARVGKVAHRPNLQALQLGREELHVEELVRAIEQVFGLKAGDRNPAQALLGASEGPSVAHEQLRLADQPGGGEGPSPGLVDPPKPPGVLVVSASEREGVSNGRCDPGARELPELRARGSGPG
ncbi:MAG TPA: hypothetical protein VKR21_19390 [Solirubrobacteraceae bacterium]|nr:hypothetical protein [Solirubrobacteraceae bacterium]